MVNTLVFENLKHRPVRTLLSVLAIGIEVVLMLTLVGLSRGVLEEYARRAQGTGADIIVRPPGSSVMSFTTASMNQKFVDYFRQQPHVRLVVGNVIWPLGGFNSLSGIDLQAFDQMTGGLRYLQGGPIRDAKDLLIDEDYARQNQKRVGDTVSALNTEWRIAGIIESGKLSRLFMPLDRLQELTATTGKLSQIFIKLDDPNRAEEIAAAFQKEPALAEYKFYPVKEFVSLYSVDNVPGLKPFIGVIVGLSVVVGFLVVSLTMYTAVLERTREIGILKALGATPGFITTLLLRETLVLAAIGIVVGILMSFITRWLITTLVPASLAQVIVPDWWVYAGLIAIAGAVLGALYPGYKAARQDAIEALSYE